MSHMSQVITIVFQWLPTYVRNSTRHGRDMADDNPKHGFDSTGRPLNPQHPWNRNQETPEQERTRIVRSRLQMYERAWKSGSLPAVTDAVADCAGFGVPPPSWLVRAVTRIVVQQLMAPIPGAKGKFNTAKAVLKNELVHYVRWDAVVEVRERDERLSWDEAFLAVSKVLKGDAAGSKDTIEASYKKIQKGMRDRSSTIYLSSRVKLG